MGIWEWGNGDGAGGGGEGAWAVCEGWEGSAVSRRLLFRFEVEFTFEMEGGRGPVVRWLDRGFATEVLTPT